VSNMIENEILSNNQARKTFNWVWKLMLKRPFGLMLVVFLFMIVTLCDIFTPVLIRNFLATFEVDVFDTHKSTVAAVWMISIGWFFCYVFQYLGYLANSHYQTFGMANIYKDLYDRIQFAPSIWHANELMGATVVKITRTVRGYEVFTDSFYLSGGFLATILISLGTTIILALDYPMIALGISSSIALGTIILIYMTIYITGPANRLANDEESAIGGALADRIVGNYAVKSFATENIEKRTLSRIVNRWRIIEYKSWNKSSIAGLIYEFSIMIAYCFAAYFCIHYTKQNMMPLSDVAFVFFTVSIINANARQLGRIVLDMQKSLNDIEDGAALDILKPEISGDENLDRFEKTIQFKNVKFRYPEKENNVLDLPNLIIPKGQKIGLMGSSGAGKSTLVNLLTRFYNVSEGSISIDNQAYKDINVQSLRRHIAVIPQDTALFHRSLAENIGYGRENPEIEQIIKAAKQAHAHEFISELPEGYDTLVGERGVKLSGGQRQRIAIARAILKDAPILILDEATSALDSQSEKLIQDSLKDLMKDKTVIAIAHRLSTISHLDRLIVMDQGRIVQDGTHAELKEQDGLYAKLWNMQSGGFLGE